jgi:hypothetical protein
LWPVVGEHGRLGQQRWWFVERRRDEWFELGDGQRVLRLRSVELRGEFERELHERSGIRQLGGQLELRRRF